MKKFISSILAVSVASMLIIPVNAESPRVINGDFSDGANGWETTALVENGALKIRKSDYVKQYVSIENGVYDLTASFTNTDVSQNAYVYAKTDDSVAARVAIPQYDSPTPVTVRGVTITNGSVEIGVVAPKGGVTMDDVTLTPASSKETEFLKGGEISKLTYVESRGGKFHDAYGNERDALQIMAENGFNLARIRVLNNPGKGRGDGTYYLPEGFQTEEDCLDMARRAKDKGMKIQFSFAYSDYWSDGGQQYIPYEWQTYITENNITDKQALANYLSGQVYDYTKKVMQDLIAQDTVPEYVSIGNEMQYGILFGQWENHNGLYNTNGTQYQVQILNAGARAVRETSPDSKIILHSDNGGKIISKRGLFYNTFVSKVDCDIIGVSYYPYYNTDVSIDMVVNEFNTMISKYNKDVMIMETGYNWNELRGDGWEGQLQNNGYYQKIYGETKDGQHAFLTELYAKLQTGVKDGRCIADLYWDPIMLYDGGKYVIGWAVKEAGDYTDANVVSNSNLFDFDGNALPSQSAMKYNSAMSSNLRISGKTDTISSRITLTVNGAEYTVNTDKYGEYIAVVPYADRLEISLDGYDDAYSVNAPEHDFMIRNVSFPKPEFSYSTKSGNITLPLLEKDASVIAAFYRDGVLQNTELFEARTDMSSIKTSPLSDSETVRVFLWDNMRPLSDAARIDDK